METAPHNQDLEDERQVDSSHSGIARRVALIAWIDCTDGAIRREFAMRMAMENSQSAGADHRQPAPDADTTAPGHLHSLGQPIHVSPVTSLGQHDKKGLCMGPPGVKPPE